MIYKYENKKSVSRFMKSSAWLFIILLMGVVFLIVGKNTYSLIAGLAFLFCFIPRIFLFINHKSYSKKAQISIDVSSKNIYLLSKTKEIVIPYNSIEKIQQCLPGSLYSKTFGIIQTTWEDFYFAKIILKDGTCFCISSLVLNGKFFSPYGIIEERRFLFFPWIGNEPVVANNNK